MSSSLSGDFSPEQPQRTCASPGVAQVRTKLFQSPDQVEEEQPRRKSKGAKKSKKETTRSAKSSKSSNKSNKSGKSNKSNKSEKQSLKAKKEQPARRPVDVFLRIRPLSGAEAAAKHTEIIDVNSQQQINIKAPKDSQTYRNNGEVEEKYIFTRVFGAETTQKQLFTHTSVPLVQQFLSGENCLMFAYGVTSAGKTFTIQGTKTEPGLVPRIFDVVFNSISGNENPRGEESANKSFMETIGLNELIAESKKLSVTASVLDTADEDTDGERANDKTVLTVPENHCFAVWMSYVEVYNEEMYDLLCPPPKENERRKALKGLGGKENPGCCKGARQVYVRNCAEAEAVLRAGQRNRQVAQTMMNVESSRSHAVLTVKLVAVPLATDGTPYMEEPAYFSTSHLTVIDLAGSERSKKTQATGMRQKEASKINNSLMVLGQCLRKLRENQQSKNQQEVPFRESKLTMLLQSFYVNDGQVGMIVNVSPCSAHYEETLHVLRFSAIAKDVTTAAAVKSKINTGRLEHKKEKPAFPIAVKGAGASASAAANASSMMMATTAPQLDISEIEMADAPADEEDFEVDVAALMEENNLLRFKIIEQETKRAHLEAEIRAEVAEEMAERLTAMETLFRSQQNHEAMLHEEKFDRRLSIINNASTKKQKRQSGIYRELEALQEEYDELQANYNNVAAELKQAKSAGADKEVEKQLKAKTAETQDLLRKVASQQRALDAAERAKVEAVAAAEAKLRTEFEGKNDQVVADVQAEVQSLERDLHGARKENARLQAQIAELLKGAAAASQSTHTTQSTAAASMMDTVGAAELEMGSTEDDAKRTLRRQKTEARLTEKKEKKRAERAAKAAGTAGQSVGAAFAAVLDANRAADKSNTSFPVVEIESTQEAVGQKRKSRRLDENAPADVEEPAVPKNKRFKQALSAETFQEPTTKRVLRQR